jgi:hypothetical protein
LAAKQIINRDADVLEEEFDGVTVPIADFV